MNQVLIRIAIVFLGYFCTSGVLATQESVDCGLLAGLGNKSKGVCEEKPVEDVEKICAMAGPGFSWNEEKERCQGLVYENPLDSLADLDPEAPWSIEELDGKLVLSDSPGEKYEPHSNASVGLPPIAAPIVGTYILSFRTSYDLEQNYDTGKVEEKKGDGWASVKTFSGSSSGEELHEISITNTQIRFRINSDSSYQMDGWYLDDLKIYRVVPLKCARRGPQYKWTGKACVRLEKSDKIHICEARHGQYVGSQCVFESLRAKQSRCEANLYRKWQEGSCRDLTLAELRDDCLSTPFHRFKGNRCYYVDVSERRTECLERPQWQWQWVPEDASCVERPLERQKELCRDLGALYGWFDNHCRLLTEEESIDRCEARGDYFFWQGSRCAVNSAACVAQGENYHFTGVKCKQYDSFAEMCDDLGSEEVSKEFEQTVEALKKLARTESCVKIPQSLPKLGPRGTIRLNLTGKPLGNLYPIAAIPHVSQLFISDTNSEDLSPLARMISLERLRADDNNITDLSALAPLANLRFVSAVGETILDGQSLCINQEALEDIYISGYSVPDEPDETMFPKCLKDENKLHTGE